ncbi:LacI family DNA-binding transcriptional regulator [Amaricoccus solimangrovi]|uniref:LacI family transcriptional regulator n=1 Tax=Amaricoccus solimangrovi TaxID=2589815 RepID=A0A501WLE7_9RHOB|nr:LacI family DNA-binding transcriptional regulator [Amaricoccus solimangrovi]TPE46486.1 LacI family transcriptional regulator [Amaricoccus solimangrovi]
MERPTIAGLAQAAGVSVATVNRVLAGSASVRPATLQRVRDAAQEIGYHGLGAIEDRRRKTLPRYRLGFLLQQSSRELYRLFGREIEAAAAARRDAEIEAELEFVDDLGPENIAARLLAMGGRCDATAVIAGDHPLIGQAIQALKARGSPVIAYITDQSAPERAGYVGTDNWKLGRAAAWFIAQTTCRPGRVQVFIGNHRYQCQDISEASFRSYMREHARHLVVDETLPTHEEPREAYLLVSRLLAEAEDLVGIYVAGGGISGVLQALREAPERAPVRIVCRDIGPETRRGLAEGLITAALCHPLGRTSDQLVQTMIEAIRQGETNVVLQRSIPFEIVIPETL